MNLEHAMLVIAVAAPGRLRASVPVQSAFSAGHGTADLDHGTTIAADCPDDPLESITLTPFQWNPYVQLSYLRDVADPTFTQGPWPR